MHIDFTGGIAPASNSFQLAVICNTNEVIVTFTVVVTAVFPMTISVPDVAFIPVRALT